ncbi:MAG TPA: nickel pincer cofactor biosynthesis protein LarB [Pirellulales bacterium]|nr:nickel pincer cofactor biosynthesis protein LarB [Pirellulales bacterium]
MDSQLMQQLAEQLLGGRIALADFLREAAQRPTADLHEAQIDLDRRRRCGFPEVVFGEGKSVPTLERIFRALVASGVDAFATRISAEKAAELLPLFPDAVYSPLGRTFRVPTDEPIAPRAPVGRVVVATAGTSDLPVAEEARETLAWMGAEATMIFDIGVAGPHRLREQLHQFDGADAVVVIAGMEGALPSVVGGYVDCPVIAVPTSVGYGASFGGIAALLGMLNSCAANVTVVNIDAGFKGAYVAGLIAQSAARLRAGARLSNAPASSGQAKSTA